MVIELPAGMLMKVLHPRYVIGGNAILFGVFACAMSAAKSYAPVMVLRVLIGLSEAFVNNAYLYISLWYRPDELALRTGKSIRLKQIELTPLMNSHTLTSNLFSGNIRHGSSRRRH